MSQLRIDRYRHGGDQAIGRELLAVHPVRRRLERVAYGPGSRRSVPMAMTSVDVVRELRELIAALDRRVPQVQRAGEITIASEAAALRALAVKRLAELERAGD